MGHFREPEIIRYREQTGISAPWEGMVQTYHKHLGLYSMMIDAADHACGQSYGFRLVQRKI
jgi:hypothetical protein